MKKSLMFFIFLLIISCTSINFPNHTRWLCSKKIACKRHPTFVEPIEPEFSGFYNNYRNYRYEDFPNEDIRYGNIHNKDAFEEGGMRFGTILDGYKEGKWLSGDAGFDKNNNVVKKGNLWKEEYFKNGLRDSIFKQFNSEGKIIYETTFKMGTGLWKEFHANGKLYFEAYTKDGYFTDTLKLYNAKGKLAEKLLYKRDSLIYSEKYNPDIVDTLENGKKVKIIFENNKILRKEFANENWWYNKDGKVYLKSKDTVINAVKKSYQEYMNGDLIVKTVYIRNNPKIEYELVSRYSKNVLRSQIKVTIDQNGNAIETEKRYSEKGEIASITTRKHKAYENIKENDKYEKTDYYKSGKKYKWSELIYKETQKKKNFGRSDEIIQFKELDYYNLKNELIEKEYIKNTSGESGGGCEGIIPYKIEEILKKEYFEKGKLIKTEQTKNP
jgi:antitoxin component YwqK of YwqJK toxin-antitoxin module